ncbi:MAG TPA: MBL fold metallo-hydrolase [Candidatus Dormibacteraeota bacterium]|nr:MBL fold metallo-hydrolase [Candidatus Dormibacteraeota bacterium]
MSCRLKTEELRAQRSKLLAAALLPWFLALAGGAPAQTVTGHTGGTKVILLGTGTPRPFPERSGPATAIVVDDKAYLVDFGPGVIRRAAAAAAQGTPALEVTKLTVAFLTHLHSDHTVGYPDLIFTPWVMGRKEELNVYGPEGIEEMTKHVLQAWQQDSDIRTKGMEHAEPLLVRAHDVKPGVVYTDESVKVTAFRVPHGEWPQAFGYRFDARGRTIVISGDTSPSSELVANCQKCDVLIHEVYSPVSVVPSMPDWTAYRAKYHTSTEQLAEIANRSKPGILIVYHTSGRGPNGRIPEEQILQEIQKTYHGKVVIGHDLEIY